MGLDPAFFLMKDGSDGEVGFEVFEGFFDSDELDVVLPEGSGVAFGEIGAQQIAAFAAADRTQLVAVEGTRRSGCGWRTPIRRSPAGPRRKAAKSSGPTRLGFPIRPTTAAA